MSRGVRVGGGEGCGCGDLRSASSTVDLKGGTDETGRGCGSLDSQQSTGSEVDFGVGASASSGGFSVEAKCGCDGLSVLGDVVAHHVREL